MKSSLVRGFVIFAAGAATAALASGLYPKEPITAAEFQERADKLLIEVEALGAYVAVTEHGRVGLHTDPYFCIPPVPPVPVLPMNSVDPRTLELATRALISMNQGYLMAEHVVVYEVDKCKPGPETLIKK